MVYVWVLVLFFLGLLFFYFMAQSVAHCVTRKYWIFLTPFWLLMSENFDESGNVARRKALIVMMVGVVLIVIGKST